MTGLVGTFGNKAVAESMAVIGLKNEEWQLGYKNDAQVLFADVTGRSIHAVSALTGALEEKNIGFSNRTRTSNETEIIEVVGDGFSKLTNILGEDRVNQLNIDLQSPVINSAQWKEGFKTNASPVIYADTTDLNEETRRSVVRGLNSLGIESSSRVNSQGRDVLEVMGKSIPMMTKVADIATPDDKGNDLTKQL
jgi:hypothetical protein